MNHERLNPFYQIAERVILDDSYPKQDKLANDYFAGCNALAATFSGGLTAMSARLIVETSPDTLTRGLEYFAAGSTTFVTACFGHLAVRHFQASRKLKAKMTAEHI